jgi:4'-phosphopantetheinyl transferase EntD
MDPVALLRAWRRLLPPSASVCAGPFEEQPPSLTDAERRSAGQVDPGRLLELENGRLFARRALAGLGVTAADLPIGDDRAPRWPEGIVGSLTHAGRVVAVAVARETDVSALGIDLEPEVGLDPRLWEGVLTAGERARVLTLPPPERPAEAQVLWCLKEAALKASRRRLDPVEIDVRRESDADGVVAWTIDLGLRAPGAWTGRSLRAEGCILAAVAAERTGPSRPR